MFGFKKHKKEEPTKVNARLVKKILGKDSGRRVFGFICSPSLQAQLKMLAGQLQVPIFALSEHLLQLSAGQIAKMADNPEEWASLRKHIIEIHVEARTIEKISAFDEDMGERLNLERLRGLDFDKSAHQIVMDYMRNGLSPKEIPGLIDYGLRCRIAIAKGMPIPKDLTPDD